MFELINGKKTYITGIAALLLGVGGYIAGTLPATEAAEIVILGLGLCFLKHSDSRLLKKVLDALPRNK